MYTTLKIRKLSTSSVFKLVALGAGCSLIPLMTLMGLLSFFGAGTMQWNGKPMTGLPSLIASPFMGALFALLITAFLGSLLSLGLWLYSLVRPLKLSYWTDDAASNQD
jgi:hypothetical protein